MATQKAQISTRLIFSDALRTFGAVEKFD